MEKKENKASAILMNIDIVVASIILAILIVLTFLGVVWRYIFNAPFTWLEEVQTSCMVWIVFAGAGAALDASPSFFSLFSWSKLLVLFEMLETFNVKI